MSSPPPQRRPQRPKPPTVKRSVYFYRIDAGADETGIPKNIDADLDAGLKAIDDLPFDSVNRRYMNQSDGSSLCAWIDATGEVVRLRLGTIRKNALPQSELGGTLRNLALDTDEGLCETSHICLFPDGIVGVEHNFYGPRAKRLPVYMAHALSGAIPSFAMEALLNHNTAKQLEGNKSVRKLTLRVRKSYTSTIGEASRSLGEALDAAALGSDAAVVGLILQPEPYKRVDLKADLIHFLRRIMLKEDLREQTRELKATIVDEQTGRADEINLLEDQLISKKTILRQTSRSRVLNSDDAYRKIEEAYRELREDLLSASSASVSSKG
ncbi:hypothetical protein [Nonomuraea endophytica]|uniref:Uncharacterized protein n=1 Tax=Nonomuraea endophytica TaxID=714136 RepID=A0A7W8AD91_9ACTN|nr:hypothetical protein [Nonomuraea endophytica]MBB5082623.1 hypothetical protein [Nonomuraea endophytica]